MGHAPSNVPRARVIEGDVCDVGLLQCIFERVPIARVVHLAAQAGVHFSKKEPLSYVRSNIQCFVVLLEAVQRTNAARAVSIPVIYASSSSVYGMSKKIPFAEDDAVVQPASVYGATKRSDELLAHVYHHIYGLRVTGLRFFTVYGPYGRPDMACFLFTNNILANKSITVYENADGSEPQRDFTYIDDIVRGVLAATRLGALPAGGSRACPAAGRRCERRCAGADYELFNLGNHHPEKLSTLIRLLESGIGQPARQRRETINAGARGKTGEGRMAWQPGAQAACTEPRCGRCCRRRADHLCEHLARARRARFRAGDAAGRWCRPLSRLVCGLLSRGPGHHQRSCGMMCALRSADRLPCRFCTEATGPSRLPAPMRPCHRPGPRRRCRLAARTARVPVLPSLSIAGRPSPLVHRS